MVSYAPAVLRIQNYVDAVGADNVHPDHHTAAGIFAPGTGCTIREELHCSAAGRSCANHACQ